MPDSNITISYSVTSVVVNGMSTTIGFTLSYGEISQEYNMTFSTEALTNGVNTTNDTDEVKLLAIKNNFQNVALSQFTLFAKKAQLAQDQSDLSLFNNATGSGSFTSSSVEPCFTGEITIHF
jgi:hypothetical protein